MAKAIFFSGCGTGYLFAKRRNKKLEIYPETLPALRFLGRRGYILVLVASDFLEYQLLQAALKDKTLPLFYCSSLGEELDIFLAEKAINLSESYLITDHGSFLTELDFGWQTILVLTGKGVSTLQNLEARDLDKLFDICKNIYAAAISIALQSKPEI